MYETVDTVRFIMSEAGKYPRLTEEQERELSVRVLENQDADAKHQLVLHNLRLVVMVAKRFWLRQGQYRDVTLEDMIQEGILGLYQVVGNYDYQIGRFSSFAIPTVEGHLKRYLQVDGNTIRIPPHVHSDLAAISRAKLVFEREGIFDPTHEQLAQRTGLTTEQIARRLEAQKLTRIKELEVTRPTAEGKTLPLIDRLPDKFVPSPELFMLAYETLIEFKGVVSKVWQKRGIRDCSIFLEYLGCDKEGVGNKTLEEVGSQYGLTRQGTRLVVMKACASLKISLDRAFKMAEAVITAREVLEESGRSFDLPHLKGLGKPKQKKTRLKMTPAQPEGRVNVRTPEANLRVPLAEIATYVC